MFEQHDIYEIYTDVYQDEYVIITIKDDIFYKIKITYSPLSMNDCHIGLYKIIEFPFNHAYNFLTFKDFCNRKLDLKLNDTKIKKVDMNNEQTMIFEMEDGKKIILKYCYPSQVKLEYN
jgi:hypothetical protein